MKKLTALILLCALVISFCSCSLGSGQGQEPVVFYYPWADLETVVKQNPEITAIGSETRDISSHRNNLRYVLTLYLRGPQDSSLISPFPNGTAVMETRTENDTLVISLNAPFSQLSGIDLTIACTCLAQTCFELTDVQTVMVQTAAAGDSSQTSISITRDGILLTDSIPETTPTTE